MKIVIPGLAAAFFVTVGAGTGAQAAVQTIDFVGGTLCPATCTGITYTGATLASSSAIDLDGVTWQVTQTRPGDGSGLVAGNSFSLTPTTGSYDDLSGVVNRPILQTLTKSWIATTGPFAGGTYTETLNLLHEVDRGARDTIAFIFDGKITGPAGSGFLDSPAVLALSFNQSGGPGSLVSVSLTDTAASVIPEPSTWVMLALGFAGLGYAAIRRNVKDKAALAV
jgi:hypothetical protein